VKFLIDGSISSIKLKEIERITNDNRHLIYVGKSEYYVLYIIASKQNDQNYLLKRLIFTWTLFREFVCFLPTFFFIPSESNQDAIPDDSIVSNSNATNSSKLILFVALSKLNFDLIGVNLF